MRDDALRDQLNGLSPRLRRYARALTTGHPGPCDFADEVVHATLVRALGARHAGGSADLLIRLYATVTQLNREMAVSGQQARAAGAGRPTLIDAGRNFSAGRETKLSGALLSIPLEAREALLLVGLEGFDYGEASRILRISRNTLITRLTQARTMLDAALRGPPIRAAQTADSGSGGAAAMAASRSPMRPPYLRLVT